VNKPVQLCDSGVESYSVRSVVFANLMMTALIAAGTIACWLLSPVLGGLYVTFSVLMVYVVLRRLVCTRCYYYGKRCGAGWGLLASAWFRRRSIEEFNENAGTRLAPMVYGLVMLVPLIALAVLLVRDATTLHLILLAVILAIGFYSSGPGRKKSCFSCKMRLFCKGSMAREL
jgi:hypothetical protein